MSVLIKGMDVPPNCWWCLVKFWNDAEYICPFSHKHINSGDADRHDDCPLIELPDHGDLVEVERAYDEIAEQAGKGNYIDMDAVDAGLQNAPVIIPAERSEE